MDLVEKIKNSHSKLFMVLTGGGLDAITRLTKGGGASKIFLGAEIPYCTDYLDDLTGFPSGKYKAVDSSVANTLANCNSWAFPITNPTVFLGSTASLVKHNREREGRIHEAYICARIGIPIQGDNPYFTYRTYHLVLNEDRTREEEEDLLSTLILAVANEAMNVVKINVTYRPYFESLGFSANDLIELVEMG